MIKGYEQLASWPNIIFQTTSLYNTCEKQISLLLSNLLHGATAELKNPILSKILNS